MLGESNCIIIRTAVISELVLILKSYGTRQKGVFNVLGIHLEKLVQY